MEKYFGVCKMKSAKYIPGELVKIDGDDDKIGIVIKYGSREAGTVNEKVSFEKVLLVLFNKKASWYPLKRIEKV